MAMAIFEPQKPKRRWPIMITVLDVVMLAVLAIAFTLLDIVFRDTMHPTDALSLRYLMMASWLVVFLFILSLGYVRAK